MSIPIRMYAALTAATIFGSAVTRLFAFSLMNPSRVGNGRYCENVRSKFSCRKRMIFLRLRADADGPTSPALNSATRMAS
ncbi:hypothetical protein D3C73_1590690 [compost metagenome]